MSKVTPGLGVALMAVAFAMFSGPALAESSGQASSQAKQSSERMSQAGETGTAAKSDQDRQTGKMEQSGKSERSGSIEPPVVYMVFPVRVAGENSSIKSGCWARFHDEDNYRGDQLTLIGPVDMPDMKGPFGIDWKDKISSIETGPKATVLVYDNENYKDLVATFKPGQRVPDVSDKMGFFDDFSSLKISCGK